MRTSPPLSRTLALACLLPASALLAQDNPPAEEEVVLAPFYVQAGRDVGYNSESSTAGGRLSIELINSAAQISVLNRQFLDDIGATSYLDAINWAPNTQNDSAAGIDVGNDLFNESRVSFRGLPGNFNTRNFFRTYVNLDSYNLERADFSRGPNSLVAGDAGLVGTVNLSSKLPTWRNRYEAQLRVTDEGGYRGVLDVDLRVSDAIAVRGGLLYDLGKTWREREENQREGGFLVAQFRPSKTTQITIEGEVGSISRNLGLSMLEASAFWNGTQSVTTPITSGNYGNGVIRITSDRLLFNPSAPELGVLNFRNYGETNGSFIQIIEGVSVPWASNDRTVVPNNAYHLNAPNAESVQDYEIFSATVNQQLGDRLFVEAAFQWAEQYRSVDQVFWDTQRIDVNQQLPNGAANPRFGEYYADQNWYREVYQGNEAIEGRVSAAYLFDSELTRQRFLAAVNFFDEDFNYTQDGLQRVGGPVANVTNVANRIGIRRYANDREQDYLLPVLGSAMPGGGTAEMVRLGDRGSNVKKTFYQLAANGAWFEKSWLHTLVGWRRDSIQTSNESQIVVDGIATGRNPSVVSLDEDYDLFTYSAVAKVSSWFSVFAGYSETFTNPQERLLLSGDRSNGSFGDGSEIGMRFHTTDNRFTASLNYYDSEIDAPAVGGESTRINNIWTDLGRSEVVTTGYFDRRINKAKGWELQVGYSPTRAWSITANVSFPKTAIIDELPDTRAYVAANSQTWANGLAGITDPAVATRIQDNITQLNNRLASAVEGREVDGSLDYTANLFTNYRFVNGPLKGFNIGGGVNIRGDRLIGNQPGQPFNYVKSNGYSLFSLVAGYRTTIRNANVRIQMNISNLLNEQIIRESRYSSYNVGGVSYFIPDRYAIVAPRMISLSTTIQF